MNSLLFTLFTLGNFEGLLHPTGSLVSTRDLKGVLPLLSTTYLPPNSFGRLQSITPLYVPIEALL